MIKHIFYKVTLLSLFANLCLASDVDNIKWSMQNYPPFTYVNEKSENTGLAADIVSVLFKRLHAKKTIDNVDIVTFARGIADIKAEKDNAFFTVVRLPEREALFKWVGPIGMNRPVIIAKKNRNIKINAPADLKKYTIGVKRNASIESLLRDLGVDDSSLQPVGAEEESMKKFFLDRTDLVAINDLPAYFLMDKLKMNRNDYEVVYHLKENDLAIAFSNNVSDDFIKEMQKQLDEMKISKDGQPSEYETIIKHYQ